MYEDPPSYITKEGGQSKTYMYSFEPNYKSEGLKHILGIHADLSL